MAGQHHYRVQVAWTGNTGRGTASHAAYRRDHEITAADKPAIPGSSDPAFRGDPSRWNPEELFLAALSACHTLWYLALCAQAGIVVTGYEDRAGATLTATARSPPRTGRSCTLHWNAPGLARQQARLGSAQTRQRPGAAGNPTA